MGVRHRRLLPVGCGTRVARGTRRKGGHGEAPVRTTGDHCSRVRLGLHLLSGGMALLRRRRPNRSCYVGVGAAYGRPTRLHGQGLARSPSRRLPAPLRSCSAETSARALAACDLALGPLPLPPSAPPMRCPGAVRPLSPSRSRLGPTSTRLAVRNPFLRRPSGSPAMPGPKTAGGPPAVAADCSLGGPPSTPTKTGRSRDLDGRGREQIRNSVGTAATARTVAWDPGGRTAFDCAETAGRRANSVWSAARAGRCAWQPTRGTAPATRWDVTA